MRLTFSSVYANPDVLCAHRTALGSVGDPLHQGGRRWGCRCDPAQGNLRFRSVLAASLLSSSLTLPVVAAAACVQYRSLRNRPIKTAKVTRVSPL
ncbi:unnamed protein product [Macrosiphum euphorbiae]|uniref:Uncharacterized protein n=1 Tax=Macrosiphum euphorbiae TaxID=13131 RepID=A0AAV0VX05_9HEMI|nr:unnamed protein product [Macrosiphum euphorbiae]